eukprot:scaffold134923_cov27-Attheya_sp.AAC.1
MECCHDLPVIIHYWSKCACFRGRPHPSLVSCSPPTAPWFIAAALDGFGAFPFYLPRSSAWQEFVSMESSCILRSSLLFALLAPIFDDEFVISVKKFVVTFIALSFLPCLERHCNRGLSVLSFPCRLPFLGDCRGSNGALKLHSTLIF